MPTLTIAACASVLGWTLIVLAWIDFRHFYLPNKITIPLMFLGFMVTALTAPKGLLNHAIGAGVGYAAILLVNKLYRMCRHRDGIGLGDAKLLAAAGAWTGWEAMSWIVILAALFGIAAVIVLHFMQRMELRATTKVPFGSCLAPAIFLVYYLQNSCFLDWSGFSWIA